MVDALTRPYNRDANDPVRLVGHIAGVLSVGAGVIHISAAGDHTNLPVMFVGFLVVAALQIALGALLLWRRPSRLVLSAAVALMLGAIGTWLLSRTSGLPFLENGHQEPIGFKDGVTVLFEIGSIPLLLLLFSSELDRVALPSPRFVGQTIALVGAGTFALMTPAMLLDGGGHHSHEQAVEMGIHGHDEETAASTDAPHAAASDHHAERRDTHSPGDHSPSGKTTHGHNSSPPTDDAHGHSDVELTSFPTGGGHGHSGPGQPPQGDHGERGHDDAHGQGGHGDRTRRGRRGGDHHDGDRDRRGGGRRGGGGDGHGGHGDDGEADGADEPEGPLDGVVSDVMDLVPGSAGRAR